MTMVNFTKAQPFTPALTKESSDLLYRVTRAILTSFFAILLFVALQPDVRSQVRGSLVQDYRTVVSTASGHLAGDERNFTVAKVKTRDSLSLEIFELADGGKQKLVEKIVMADAKDGYFNFNGQATNLAIDDIDGDGRPEILAPSFDSNLVGRLNVYSFDQASGNFQKVLR